MKKLHLERLLRSAVIAGDPVEIERLVRKGAVGSLKGKDGRMTIELVTDIKDPEVRIKCRYAFLAKEYEEWQKSQKSKTC